MPARGEKAPLPRLSRDARPSGPIRARGAAPHAPPPPSLRKGARAGPARAPCAAAVPRAPAPLPSRPAPLGRRARPPPAQKAPQPRAPTAPARGCRSERGDGAMLALLAAGVALAVAAAGQDVPAPGSRFVCTALPPEAARAGCPLPAMPGPGGALSPEEELRAAVLQLRETVVQQKETLGAQREAIRELTAKLARCEGLAGAKAPGRAATGKDTMGDLPRDPGHLVEQLSRSLQTLKDRLESLEVAGRRGPTRGGRPGRGGARGPAREATRERNELGLGAGGLDPTCVARALHPVRPPRAGTAHWAATHFTRFGLADRDGLLASCKSPSPPGPHALPEAVAGRPEVVA